MRAAFRKPFVPPSPERPLIVRSIDYAGEEHPVTNKRAITVSVDELPLHSERAKHKVKLLAGTRWTPSPPKDAGVQGSAVWANGFIKISCEDFPDPAMNLKWASDTLDRLIVAANVRGPLAPYVPERMLTFVPRIRETKSPKSH